MAIYDNWQNGLQYSFSTVPQGILPLRYSFVTLELESTWAAAKSIGGMALYSQWRTIYPHLADKTIADDPSQYAWYMFTTGDGSELWMTTPWIDGNSVVPVKFRQERITLTDTNEFQISQVKNFLSAMNAKFVSEPITQ